MWPFMLARSMPLPQLECCGDMSVHVQEKCVLPFLGCFHGLWGNSVSFSKSVEGCNISYWGQFSSVQGMQGIFNVLFCFVSCYFVC